MVPYNTLVIQTSLGKRYCLKNCQEIREFPFGFFWYKKQINIVHQEIVVCFSIFLMLPCSFSVFRHMSIALLGVQGANEERFLSGRELHVMEI